MDETYMTTRLLIMRKGIISQVKDIAKELLPKGQEEIILFFILLIFYLSYSLYLGFETALVAHASKWYDLYFSFDNVVSFFRGYSNLERHPFLQIFMYPLMFVKGILSKYMGMSYRVILTLMILSSLIALSIVYVHRYLSKIVGVSNFQTRLIVGFYSFFSTNLILAFTFESFTFSLHLLSFAVYYFSKQIKEGQQVKLFTNLLAFIILGGVTITNGAKSVIPILFQKGTIPYKTRIVLVSICTFLLLLLFVDYNFRALHPDSWGYFKDVSNHSYLSKVLSFFFGMPILLNQMYLGNVIQLNYYDPMIASSIYEFWWQYLFVILIIAIIVYSILMSYKNRLVQYLFLLFFFDVLIHAILRAGLHEAMIYGAHWIYTVPLFIGWLYKNLGRVQQKALTGLLICMLVVLATNNMVRMIEFTNLALEYFPKTESAIYK